MRRLALFATIAALFSAVMWLAAIVVAVGSFNRSNEVAYSCWNHAISELGFPYASRSTWAFDGMLVMGSLLLLPALYAVSACLGMRLAAVAKSFGVVSCLAAIVVGLLGLKQDVLGGQYIFLRFMEIHLALAAVFFLGWLVTMTLFTIEFCHRWEDASARPVAVAGVLSVLLYPIFALVIIFADPMRGPLLKSLRDPAFRAIITAPSTITMLSPWMDCHRPPVWWPAVLEWASAVSILIWFGAALWFVWRKAEKLTNAG